MARKTNEIVNNAISNVLPSPTEKDFIKLDKMSLSEWAKSLNCNPEDLDYADNPDNPEHPWIVLDDQKVGMVGDIEGNKPLIVIRSKYDPNGEYIKAIEKSGDKEHLENAKNKVFCMLMRTKYGLEVKGSLSDLIG